MCPPKRLPQGATQLLLVHLLEMLSTSLKLFTLRQEVKVSHRDGSASTNIHCDSTQEILRSNEAP